MNSGGLERCLSVLLRIWVDLGHEVILYTDEKPNKEDFVYPNQVKRIVLPKDEKQIRKKFWEEEISRNRIDLFIEHYYWNAKNIIEVAQVVKKNNVPFYLYIHGNYTSMYKTIDKDGFLFHDAIKICDKVLCLSKINKDFIELCGGKAELITNPVYDSLVKNNISYECRVYKDVKHILWLGRIDEGKHLDEALIAFNNVANRYNDIILDIVGDWQMTGDVNNYINSFIDAKNRNRVIYHGFSTDIDYFYKNTDIFLLTSEAEGYCYTLLESKAYSCPVVMYDLPYLSLTGEGKGIIACEQRNIGALSEALCLLISDKEKYKQCSKEAYEDFEAIKRFDINAMWDNVFNASLAKQNNKKNDSLMMDMLFGEINRTVNGIYLTEEYRIGKVVAQIEHAPFRLAGRILKKLRKVLSEK